jgi:hypothetical protein
MSGILYGLIAAGYCNETGRFWDALIWPVFLGKASARATLSEAQEGRKP